MSKPVFTWMPDSGASQTVKPTVTATKFGDGYELRTAVGINFKPKSWSVTFTQGGVATKQILDFLDARGGLEAFVWTDPMDATNTYVCRQWGSSRQGWGVYAVTATFEQVFEY
jgi:phage-related protein